MRAGLEPATAQAYEFPLEILREKPYDVILVSNQEMKEVVKTIFLATGQVAELADAASTAAAYKIKGQLRGK